MENIKVELLNFEINNSNNLNFDNNLYNKNIHQDKKILQTESLDFKIKSDKEKSSSEKKTNLENIIENKIFPKDDEMPELDDDIKNIELIESEGSLPNSIQPLTDADIVNKYSSIDDL